MTVVEKMIGNPSQNRFLANDLEFILKRSELPPEVIAGANIDYTQASDILNSKIPDLIGKVGSDRIAATQLLDIEALQDAPPSKALGRWFSVSTPTGDLYYSNGVLIDMTGAVPHVPNWEQHKSNAMESVSVVRHLIDAPLNGEKLEFLARTAVSPEDVGGKEVSELASFRKPGTDELLHVDLDYLQYFKSKLKNPTFQVDMKGTIVHVFSADKRVGIVGINTHEFPLASYQDFWALTQAKGQVLAQIMELDIAEPSEPEPAQEPDETSVLRDMSDPLRDDLSQIGSGIADFNTPEREVPVPEHLQSHQPAAAQEPTAGSWQDAVISVPGWDDAVPKSGTAEPSPPDVPQTIQVLPPDIAAKMAELSKGKAKPEVQAQPAPPIAAPAVESHLQDVLSLPDDDGLGLVFGDQQGDGDLTSFDGVDASGARFEGLDGPPEDLIPPDAMEDSGIDELAEANKQMQLAAIEVKTATLHPATESYPDVAFLQEYGMPLPKSPQTSAVAFELGEPINARAMSTEDYKLALQERIMGAVSDAHAKAIVKQEVMSTGRNQQQSEAICEEFGKIMQMIGHEKSVDAAAYALGRVFSRYSRVWDRPNAEVEQQQDAVKGRLDALDRSLDPKASPTDKPLPVPSMGLHRRTNADVAMSDIQMSLEAEAPQQAEKNYRSTTEDGQGFYADPMFIAERAKRAVDSLKPEHLADANGEIDEKWIDSFKGTLSSIRQRLEQTDMGQHIVDALKKVMDAVQATFESLVAMAKRVFGKAEDAPESASGSSPSPGM